ncbi:MAG TPA: cold-shock protein [Pseudomonadota bacterium]|jgi:CspA family cold shock protein|nr:cold-shock protein [Pseudomonadota bacterium]
MAKGNVKWFNDSKGYGFISVSDPGAQSGQDVFVHHTAILSEGYRTLSEGMEVEFDILQGEKGLLASNVRRVA